MTTHILLAQVPYQGTAFAVKPFHIEIAGTRTEAEADAFLANPTFSPSAQAVVQGGMPAEWRPWKVGDTFAVGDKRTYNGEVWRARQAHTANDPSHTPPTVPALWELVPNGTEWAQPVTYTLPATCTYQGRLYKLVQSHTSLPGWHPPAVPALWQDIGVAQVPDFTRAQWHKVAIAEPDYQLVIRTREA